MSLQQGPHQNVLYQASGHTIQNLNSVRNHMHHVCRQYANQYVHVQTLDGQSFTGRIVGCDRGFFNLAIRRPGGHQGGHHGEQHRAFFGSPFNTSDEAILTLVLYELLVITLLYL